MKSENLSGHHGDDFIPETNGLRDYNQGEVARVIDLWQLRMFRKIPLACSCPGAAFFILA